VDQPVNTVSKEVSKKPSQLVYAIPDNVDFTIQNNYTLSAKRMYLPEIDAPQTDFDRSASGKPLSWAEPDITDIKFANSTIEDTVQSSDTNERYKDFNKIQSSVRRMSLTNDKDDMPDALPVDDFDL